MAVAQLWRFNATDQQWECKGRPPRPVAPVGSSRFDLITGVVGSSIYTAPPPFVIGTTKPATSNTGVPQGMALQAVTGDVIITEAGAVVERLDVHNGHIIIRAPGVTVRYCRVRGNPAFRGYYGLVDATDAAASGALIEQCTLAWDDPQYWSYGAQGWNFTARRCHVYWVIDFFNNNTTAGPVTLEGNYCHDLCFISDSPNHINDPNNPGWTHNDGFQISGGTAHVIRGNRFDMFASRDVGDSAVMLATAGYEDLAWGGGITVSPDKGPVTDLLVEENWFSGGTAGFQANSQPVTTTNLGTIQNNRFAMDQHNFGNNSRYQIRYRSNYTVTGGSTNYFDPDSPSVPADLKGVFFTVGFTGGIRIDG